MFVLIGHDEQQRGERDENASDNSNSNINDNRLASGQRKQRGSFLTKTPHRKHSRNLKF